jgi:hypothetical protein
VGLHAPRDEALRDPLGPRPHTERPPRRPTERSPAAPRSPAEQRPDTTAAPQDIPMPSTTSRSMRRVIIDTAPRARGPTRPSSYGANGRSDGGSAM